MLAAYDVAKAKALLKEAGFPDRLTVKSIQSTLPSMLNTAQILQSQLKQAGIDLQLEVVDHQTFHANIRKDLSGAVYYTAARFPVADVSADAVLPLALDRRHADRGDELLALRGRRQGDRRRRAPSPTSRSRRSSG